MNKISSRESMFKRWLRDLRSPVTYFYNISMKPETIDEEIRQSGKPIMLYEKLLFTGLFCILVVLGLLSIVGVKWNVWVGLAGLVVAIAFLIGEVVLFRLRSFSRDVKLARSIILLFTMVMITVFFQMVVKGLYPS